MAANGSTANEEAIFSLLRRVYRAMTKEMTPASNVEEELLRVFPFFPVLVHSSLLCAIHEWIMEAMVTLYGSSRKKGRLRSCSWKGKSTKESSHNSLVIFSKTLFSIDFFTILPSLRQLCQVRDPDVVFPKLCLVASYSVLCKMGHDVISLLW